MLRRFKINKGVVEQWALIHFGLQCAKQTLPETWIASFQACNLDPRPPKTKDSIFCFLLFGTECSQWKRKKMFAIIEAKKGFTIDCLKKQAEVGVS
jgi:hypothetical protein